LAITSPRIGGRSVGIVRSLTQTIEFGFFWGGEEEELIKNVNGKARKKKTTEKT
jgi:hypothetical protein